MVVSGVHRARRLLATTTFAGLATACTAFVDLGGLSGKEAASTGDAGGPEVGFDGSSEAGSDSAAGRFCDAWVGARFCTDFDDIERSSIPIYEDNGTLALTDMTSSSPPRSALVELDTPSNMNGTAGVALALGKAGPTLRVALDMRVMKHSKDYTETLMVRSRADDRNVCEVYVVLGGSEWEVRAGCPGSTAQVLGDVPFDRWVNVSVTVDTTKETGSITVDGTTRTFAMPAAFANGDLEVLAGVYYAKSASGPIRLAVDNLVVAN